MNNVITAHMPKKKRPVLLTIYLWYVIILVPLFIPQFILRSNEIWLEKVRQAVSPEYIELFIWFNVVITIAGAIFAIAVLRWKKWGAYGLIVSFVINPIIGFAVGFTHSITFGLIFLLITVWLLYRVWGELE